MGTLVLDTTFSWKQQQQQRSRAASGSNNVFKTKATELKRQVESSNVFNTKAAMAATTNGRNTLFNTKAAAALEATSGSSVSKGATSGSSKQQAEQWQQRSDKQSSGSNKWKQCKFLRTNDP